MPGLPPPCSTPAPPTPLGLSSRVGPPRKGEGTRRRFEALLQSQRMKRLDRAAANGAPGGSRGPAPGPPTPPSHAPSRPPILAPIHAHGLGFGRLGRDE